MSAARPPACRPLAAFAPPAGPVAVAALRGGRLCCRARPGRMAVAPPPPSWPAARAATVSSSATCGWATGGRARRAPALAGVEPPPTAAAGGGGGGARSLRAALVNKKGGSAEESLGIPSAPAESELVPGDIPTSPPPAASDDAGSTAAAPAAPSRRSKKGGGAAAASGRTPVALPSLTSLKAPRPSGDGGDGGREDAAAAMDKMAADAVKQLSAEPAAAGAAADGGGGGPVAEAKAFLAAVRGEFAVVDWPESQRVVQILGFVIAAMVLSSVGIYAVDKVFMRLSSILFGSEY